MREDSGFVSAQQQVQELVEGHAALVRREALHLAAGLPASVVLDDLVQAGMLGLLESARRYVKSTLRSASFRTYAMSRIRGAMIDEMRRQDWLPRGLRAEAVRLQKALRSAEAAVGHPATAREVAQVLGVSLQEYEKHLLDLGGLQVLYAEDLVAEGGEVAGVFGADAEAGPAHQVEQAQIRALIAAAVAQLPDREQTVLSLYYEQELNNEEIGKVLGLTGSRASQLRTQAVLRLRTALQGVSWSEVQALAGD